MKLILILILIVNVQAVGMSISEVPDGFNIHKNLVRVMKNKRKAVVETGKGIDWATAEALAFGTLLNEGTHVRLSGQVNITLN
jgi:2-oxoglutarate dehydrogenase E1 component